MERLRSLMQEGTVQQYCYEFEMLFNQIQICEVYAIYLFIIGLKPEIGDILTEYHNIGSTLTLKEAFTLARNQEVTLELDPIKNLTTSTEVASVEDDVISMDEHVNDEPSEKVVDGRAVIQLEVIGSSVFSDLVYQDRGGSSSIEKEKSIVVCQVELEFGEIDEVRESSIQQDSDQQLTSLVQSSIDVSDFILPNPYIPIVYNVKEREDKSLNILEDTSNNGVPKMFDELSCGDELHEVSVALQIAKDNTAYNVFDEMPMNFGEEIHELNTNISDSGRVNELKVIIGSIGAPTEDRVDASAVAIALLVDLICVRLLQSSIVVFDPGLMVVNQSRGRSRIQTTVHVDSAVELVEPSDVVWGLLTVVSTTIGQGDSYWKVRGSQRNDDDYDAYEQDVPTRINLCEMWMADGGEFDLIEFLLNDKCISEYVEGSSLVNAQEHLRLTIYAVVTVGHSFLPFVCFLPSVLMMTCYVILIHGYRDQFILVAELEPPNPMLFLLSTSSKSHDVTDPIQFRRDWWYLCITLYRLETLITSAVATSISGVGLALGTKLLSFQNTFPDEWRLQQSNFVGVVSDYKEEMYLVDSSGGGIVTICWIGGKRKFQAVVVKQRYQNHLSVYELDFILVGSNGSIYEARFYMPSVYQPLIEYEAINIKVTKNISLEVQEFGIIWFGVVMYRWKLPWFFSITRQTTTNPYEHQQVDSQSGVVEVWIMVLNGTISKCKLLISLENMKRKVMLVMMSSKEELHLDLFLELMSKCDTCLQDSIFNVLYQYGNEYNLGAKIKSMIRSFWQIHIFIPCSLTTQMKLLMEESSRVYYGEKKSSGGFSIFYSNGFVMGFLKRHIPIKVKLQLLKSDEKQMANEGSRHLAERIYSCIVAAFSLDQAAGNEFVTAASLFDQIEGNCCVCGELWHRWRFKRVWFKYYSRYKQGLRMFRYSKGLETTWGLLNIWLHAHWNGLGYPKS